MKTTPISEQAHALLIANKLLEALEQILSEKLSDDMPRGVQLEVEKLSQKGIATIRQACNALHANRAKAAARLLADALLVYDRVRLLLSDYYVIELAPTLETFEACAQLCNLGPFVQYAVLMNSQKDCVFVWQYRHREGDLFPLPEA